MVIAKIPTKKEAEIIEKKKKRDLEEIRKKENAMALGVAKSAEKEKKVTKK